MKPEAEAKSVHERSYKHFRFHVFAFDTAHVFGAPLFGELIHGVGPVRCSSAPEA
jgi:hypothetical protein